MSEYVIRYRPGTQLAARFGSITLRPWRGPTYPDRESAEQIRAACPNADHMEVIDLEEQPR